MQYTNFTRRVCSTMKLILSFVLLFTTVSTSALAGNSRKFSPPIPDGFDQALLFIADGVIDTSISSPAPEFTGCEGLLCEGDLFQTEIMKRSPEEVIQFRYEAIEFFKARFGLDAEDPALVGRIVFRSFATNPQWGYRVQYFAGRRVDADGWKVRDGGYMIQVLDPNGIELGGEFNGVTARQNSIVFYGNYNILTEGRHRPYFNEDDDDDEYEDDDDDYRYKWKQRKKNRELVMLFRSSALAQINEDGSLNFRCEILNEKWDSTGLAIGNVANEDIDGVLLQGVGRNSILFK